MLKRPDTRRIGQQAEQIALGYLSTRGMQLVTRNYRVKQGEIDLILRDQQTLVFTEVRYRKTIRFVTPEETVNFTKQQKIITTAQCFLSQYTRSYDYLRFDVVTIIGDLKHNPEIQWIESAFEAMD